MSTGVVVARTSSCPSRRNCEALGGEGLQEPSQPLDRPLGGPPHVLLAPTPRHVGGGPGQAHADDVLAEAVVEGIEQSLARQGPSLVDHPLGDQRSA